MIMAELPQLAILTRPADRNEALALKLEQGGWQVLLAPAMAIELTHSADQPGPLPDTYDLVIFASRAAVSGYCAQLPPGYLWPQRCAIATVGSATATLVRQLIAGSYALHCPQTQQVDSEALWVLLQQQDRLPKRALMVRGQTGREWLLDRLSEHGVEVSILSVYQRRPTRLSAGLKLALHDCAQARRRATWLFTSKDAIALWLKELSSLGILSWFVECAVVLTHEKFSLDLQNGLQLLGFSRHPTDLTICKPEDCAIIKCFLSRFSLPRLTIIP